MNDKLKRIIATAVASLGLLAFAACDTNDNGGENGDESGVTQTPGGDENKNPSGGEAGEGEGEENPEDKDPSGGGDNETEEGGGIIEVEPPVIVNKPVASAVQITESAGDLEECYVQWTPAENAVSYNVYCKTDGGAYEKIDDELVREYKDYFRADAVGLKAGTYSLKVVPVDYESNEKEEYSAEATSITVLAHDRSGYAFVGGTSSGAYNEDGTLKSNAKVLYVTDANKDTVTLNGEVGIQRILDVQKKAGTPLAIRLIGSISSPDITASKAANGNKNPNTLLIKGDGKGADMAVTLEGIGNDATANGWTLRITSCTNVEVRNIGLMNTKASEPDGITLEKDDHIWVHNCDIFYGGAGSDNDQAKGDGSLDTKETSYVTHSYNHFWDSGKCNLQNMKESGDFKITYHHNWYDHSDSRHPRVRTATVHVYNNYFDGNAKYGVGVTYGASAFVENNYFRSTATMKPMLSSQQGTDALGEGTFSGENGGMIKAYGNTFEGKYSLITQNTTTDKTNLDCYLASSRDEVVPADYKTKVGGTTYNNFDTASDFYEYEVDSAEVAKEKVEKYAGRVGGGDFKWEFDDETEDSNYAIITALKTALTNYKSGLVKACGVTVGSGTTGGGTTEGGEEGGETEGGGATEGGELPGDVTRIDLTSSNKDSYPAGIVVSGNYSSNSGNLKMETGTKITVTLSEEKTVTIHGIAASKKIKINGTNVTLDGSGNYTVTVKAGETLTIEKGDSTELCYLLFD